MEYTIKKLSLLAGVSTRTLRYYDEVGILKPARINSSGYRIYGKKEIDRLQQILFYRELDISLDNIKQILFSPDYDETNALIEQRKNLLAKREHLNILIDNLEKTIRYKKGEFIMSDKEKFEGFKKQLIDDNEKKFGKEIREKYGEEQVKRSNKQFKNMTEEQYRELEELGNSVIENLKRAMETKDPAGELAQKTAELHKQWITFCWGSYDKDSHAYLAQLFVDDERFKAFYEMAQHGASDFFRDALWIFTGRTQRHIRLGKLSLFICLIYLLMLQIGYVASCFCCSLFYDKL